MADELAQAPKDEAPGDRSRRGNPLMQLVVVPLSIVVCFVIVVVLFSRLAHRGVDPEELVRSLERADRDSWQNAVSLAQVLREPRYDAVKEDAALASRLARLTEQHIESAQMDPASIRLRSYLCRALGEFRCPVVLPALELAARTRRDAKEAEVQQAAVRVIRRTVNLEEITP